MNSTDRVEMRVGRNYEGFRQVQLKCKNASKYLCLLLIFIDFVSFDIFHLSDVLKIYSSLILEVFNVEKPLFIPSLIGRCFIFFVFVRLQRPGAYHSYFFFSKQSILSGKRLWQQVFSLISDKIFFGKKLNFLEGKNEKKWIII